MKALFSLCFVILLSTFSSCKKDQGNTKPDVLFPLKVGNVWNYEIVTYDDNGGIISIDPVSMRISKDTVVNGETYFWNGAGYYRNADLNTVVSSVDAKAFYLFFKRSNVDGASFETVGDIVNNCQSKEVLTAFTQLTNVKGYQSLRNEVVLTSCNSLLLKRVTYLAPGIGITKELFYVPGSNGSVVLRRKLELISYQVD